MNLTEYDGSCQAQNEAFGHNLGFVQCENIGGYRSFLHRKVASRVRAALGLDPGTARLDVQVLSQGGKVRVQGFVGSERGLSEVARVVRQVPGVREVNLDELTIYRDV